MKRRLLQSFLLSAMMVLLSVPKVAPVGANEELETETIEQIKTENNYVNAGISRTTYDLLKTVDIPQLIPTISRRISIENTKEIEKEWHEVFTTTNVNVRKEPNEKSEILMVLPFNSSVIMSKYNSEWVEITYNDEHAYISSKYFTDIECPYTEHSVPNNRGFKSFMPYTAITDISSKQYILQKNYAYTGNYGIRQVDARYCVAIGTAFNSEIGDYVDLVLDNGEVIPAIVADIKADKHTESNNIVTAHNGCVSEFVCDTSKLSKEVKLNGDISYADENWNSEVVTIKIYDKNIFN